jgi:hypothetical protein
MNLSNDQLMIIVVTAVISTTVKEVLGWIFTISKPLAKTATISFITGLRRRWVAIMLLYDLIMGLLTAAVILICLHSNAPATIGVSATLTTFALLHIYSLIGLRDGAKKINQKRSLTSRYRQ